MHRGDRHRGYLAKLGLHHSAGRVNRREGTLEVATAFWLLTWPGFIPLSLFWLLFFLFSECLTGQPWTGESVDLEDSELGLESGYAANGRADSVDLDVIDFPRSLGSEGTELLPLGLSDIASKTTNQRQENKYTNS